MTKQEIEELQEKMKKMLELTYGHCPEPYLNCTSCFYDKVVNDIFTTSIECLDDEGILQ